MIQLNKTQRHKLHIVLSLLMLVALSLTLFTGHFHFSDTLSNWESSTQNVTVRSHTTDFADISGNLNTSDQDNLIMFNRDTQGANTLFTIRRSISVSFARILCDLLLILVGVASLIFLFIYKRKWLFTYDFKVSCLHNMISYIHHQDGKKRPSFA